MLAVEFLFLIESHDERESDKVPKALIKECWMVILRHTEYYLIFGEIEPLSLTYTHSPRERGNSAVGFGVEEVAPTSDCLTEYKSRCGYIEKACCVELLDFGINDNRQPTGNNTAVYGESAVPNRDNIVK